MYNDHSFTFKSCIQIHLEAISYMIHYFKCNEVHFRQIYILKLTCPHQHYFRHEQHGKKLCLSPKCLHLPSKYPSPSFCLYCSSSVLVSRLEFGCRESPDNGSNLTHDAMPIGQHRLTWSSLR